MTKPGLLRLLSWFSPTFPIGGYAWSSGLETACQNGAVTNKNELRDWIQTSLAQGPFYNDAIFLTAVHKQSKPVEEINGFALSFAGSKERYEETTGLGDAFIAASKPWREPNAKKLPSPISYPSAVGQVSHENDMPLQETLLAFLHCGVNNQIQAALRLMRLGQQAGVTLLAELENDIQFTASLTVDLELEHIGTGAINMEIAAMNHEILPARIFRS